MYIITNPETGDTFPPRHCFNCTQFEDCYPIVEEEIDCCDCDMVDECQSQAVDCFYRR